MDTKPLEIESESYIQHELIKFGFNVTKPTFDKEGADLLIVDEIRQKFTHFLKIQCKGRIIKSNGSYIEIPRSYVTENFLIFLYVRNENIETSLFVFFYEDIIKWNTRNNKYFLNFTLSRIETPEFKKRIFDHKLAESINDRLKSSKIKKYTSLIMDEIFMEKAISKTLRSYKEIYPDREFTRPSVTEVILPILEMYDNFNSDDKKINCHIFVYEDSDCGAPDEIATKNFTTSNGIIVKIYRETTDDFVSFEVLEYMERVINTENIILVADDITYEEPLNKLRERDIDVTLVMFSSDDGRRMFTNHMWGDVAYPIARSLGLTEYEW